jgi:hypothetical protein
MEYQVVNPSKQDQTVVIQFLGAEDVNLLKFIGRRNCETFQMLHQKIKIDIHYTH